MLKPLVVAGALAVLAAGAQAQQLGADPQVAAATAPARADARKLIGQTVKNSKDESIGEVESVLIDGAGKVDGVIVAIGGFLGVGERHVRLAWTDLRISGNGERVVVSATKEQLKALPPFAYSDATLPGRTLNESGAPAPNPTMPPTTTAAAASDPHAVDRRPTESTGDFNASGEVSGSALLGAKVYDADGESIGTVDDVYVDSKGTIRSVVISVGGFLGVMSRDVAVKWSDLHYGRDGKSLHLTTARTRDSLKAMPDYGYERRQAVRSGG